MSLARHKYHFVPNQDGWELELKQCHPPKRIVEKRRPVIIIPGYGMNSFIFGYHPNGLSMESYLTRRGFEVWSVNLRGQGGSKWTGGERLYGLREHGVDDLGAAIQYILEASRSAAGEVDVIGCSLGGTLAFVHTALVKHHCVGSIVAIGSPLRWEKVHPLLRLVFASPRLIEKIPVVGTREIMRRMYHRIIRSPFVKLYLHPDIVDLDDPEPILNIVEDPNRHMNREIAEWIKAKDIWIDGTNVTKAFKKVKCPLLCVLANRDGIVPPMSALSALEISSAEVQETLVVGTDKLHFAHADLFISRHSHDMVFKPVADWLLAQY